MTRDTPQDTDRRDESSERTVSAGRRSSPAAIGDAYSDIEKVSQSVGKIVVAATESIHTIRSAKRSGEKLTQASETDLRTDVMTAVTLLRTELENDRDRNDVYDAILSRWEGEGGFINRFDQMDVLAINEEPWLREFAGDIHRAGYELGYLKARPEERNSDKRF